MNIIQGDYGFALSFNLTNDDGTVLDLTGATSVLKLLDVNTMASLLTKTVVAAVPTSGVASFTVASTDFTTPGVYLYQITNAYSTANKTTVGTEVINVLRRY